MLPPFRYRFGEQSLWRKGGAGACEVSFKKPRDWHNLLSFYALTIRICQP
jgi:hypothetical protein